MAVICLQYTDVFPKGGWGVGLRVCGQVAGSVGWFAQANLQEAYKIDEEKNCAAWTNNACSFNLKPSQKFYLTLVVDQIQKEMGLEWY